MPLPDGSELLLVPPSKNPDYEQTGADQDVDNKFRHQSFSGQRLWQRLMFRFGFATTRMVASMLFRVGAADPLTYVRRILGPKHRALARVFLSAVALFATWLPAFRATRIDPMSALRREGGRRSRGK
jgi:hypothetical protein